MKARQVIVSVMRRNSLSKRPYAIKIPTEPRKRSQAKNLRKLVNLQLRLQNGSDQQKSFFRLKNYASEIGRVMVGVMKIQLKVLPSL